MAMPAAAATSGTRNLPKVFGSILRFRREGFLIPLVHLEHRFHRVTESVQGLASVRTGRVATAVAAVNLFLRIEEKNHEGQVIVEFKQIQVHIVDASQAHAYELVGNVVEVLQTDNLPVKFMASR